MPEKIKLNEPVYREIDAELDYCDETYRVLRGPNNFECMLTEPEDRTWHRDLEPVVAELNRMDHLLRRSLAIITKAIMHGMPITKEVAAVRNEILRGKRKD